MKPKHHAVIILAAVFLPFLWLFASAFGMFLCAHDPHPRSDLTAEQQRVIAETLGFDIAPGETLTVSYYAGFWPKTIGEGFYGDVSGVASEEDFLSRCHEETAFYWSGHWDMKKSEYSYRPQFRIYDDDFYAHIYAWEYCEDWGSYGNSEYVMMKKVQGIVNNLRLPYVVHCIIWGGQIAELGLIALIVTRIVKHRKAKKEKPPLQPG